MRSTDLQRRIDDLVAEGWTIEDEDRDRVVMVDREFGSVGSHVLVALLTIWWTMGIGNLLWAAYNYVSNSRRTVLWEDLAVCPSCGADVNDAADYCHVCGDDLEGTSRGTSVGTGSDAIACPECEAVVSEGSRYCRACGAKLAEAIPT
ncbi:zinc ribbon domain-containing protein [Natronolimnohabitans innermongolicus]|uniref:Uncharacterized protein n=1 Tax=Natronolimnohabitans innermongolicus JCM 12255 TaxID=1227499 RepID=L9XIR7_9EURY|nr:zinc ribbon domain-containing protein [Natronolimnohabitans innermongolicus]ELY61605.1 hypothetical protein C493_02036 [Natronolimnohabitans innermongolicus JCM 12255]